MTRIMPIIAAIALLFFCATAGAQEATIKIVEVSWLTEGAEPDVQNYQLYVGDTDVVDDMDRFGDPIAFNPNDSDPPAQLGSDYEMTVPAGQVQTKYFSVTAIDTSGNESARASPVSITIDNDPPVAPQGLTVTIRIVPE